MSGRFPRGGRALDPVQDAERHVERRRGVRSQHEIEQSVERIRRATTSDPVRIGRDYGWYRANIGTSGDATYITRVGVPSSDSAWAMTNLPRVMPRAGRIVGGDLWSSEARTAGTATLRVRVTESGTSTDYDLPGAVLNATTTQTASDLVWYAAPTFARGATIEARIVTTGTWAPTTADMGAIISVVFDVD